MSQNIQAAGQLKRAGYSRSRAQRRAEARRVVLPGFPKNEPFDEPEQVWEYLRGDRIQCLRCGKWYRRLGGHLEAIHGWTTEDYKIHYGLPISPGRGLVCAPSREVYRAASQRNQNLPEPTSSQRERARRASLNSSKPHYARRLRNLGEWQGQGVDGYHDDVWETFISRVAQGRTPREVCADTDMPKMSAFYAKKKRDGRFAAAFASSWNGVPFSVQASGQTLTGRFDAAVAELCDLGWTYMQIAAHLGVSTMTAYRHRPQ